MPVMVAVPVTVPCAGPVERVGLQYPLPRGKPWYSSNFLPLDLAGMRSVVGFFPDANAVVHPAMKFPEDRVYVRAVEVPEIVVSRLVPLAVDIVVVANERVAGLRIAGLCCGPAHVHPVVHGKLDQIAVGPQ